MVLSEPVILAVIAVVGTLGGALGGAGISAASARKRADTDRTNARQDAARADARRVLPRLVHTMRQWIGHRGTLGLLVAASADAAQMKQRFQDYAASDETGRDRELSTAASASLYEAVLLIRDEQIRDSITAVRELYEGFPRLIDALADTMKSDDGSGQRIRIWARYEHEFKTALDHLEAVSSEALSTRVSVQSHQPL